MAKFSKGQYVMLMKALRLARGNVEAESEKATASEDLFADVDHSTKHITIPANLNPQHWARFGFETAVKYIADALAMDSPSFSKEHFMKVVRGEKATDSSPWSKRLVTK